MNEIDSNLPPHWSRVKLGDVVDNFKRGPFGSAIKKSFFVPKGYKVYEQKNAIYNSIELGNYFIDEEKFKELEDFEVGPADFIISCSGTIGKIYRLPRNAPKGVINQALLRIRLKEKQIFEKYFLELFKSYWFQKKMLVETRGSAMLNIAGVKELKQIPIPLPPLAEQKKIVEKIEEVFTGLDSGVASLKKAKEQLRIYRQSVLASAFNGKLIGDGPIDEKSGLSEGWKWVKVKDVGEIVTGTTPAKKNFEFYGNDFPLYKPTDLNSGINTRDADDNISNLGATKARLLPVKSVMVTCIGATIGKTGMNRQVGATNQQINSIIIRDEFVPEFVYYFCISEFFQKQVKEHASSTTLPILNKSKFELLPFVEVPKNEQNQIVEEIEKRFSEADNLEKAIDDSLTKAEMLRQSILKNAFEGKLV